MNVGLELTGVQVSPDSLWRMVVQRACGHAFGATKLGRIMLKPYINAESVIEAFDTNHLPRFWGSYNALVENNQIHFSHLY